MNPPAIAFLGKKSRRPASSRGRIVAVVLLTGLLGWAGACASTAGEKQQAEVLALRGATLVDGTGTAPRRDVTILIAGGRIEEVGPTGSISIPDGARMIDARDRWIVPGLWDLHVHLTKTKEAALPLLLANGVTSVRDMGSDLEEVREMERRVEEGAVPGPRIWTPGPMLESPATLERMAGLTTREPWRRTRVAVPDPESAGRIVDSLARLGVDFVKVREAASIEVYAAIALASRARGLRLVGHAPYSMDPVEAAGLGIASIEHASYPYPLDTLPARRAEILDAFAGSGTAIVPTLVAWRTHLMHPDSIAILIGDSAGRRDPRRPLISAFLAHEWATDLEDMEPKNAETLAGWTGFLRRTGEDLAAMHEAGVPILPGSDLAGIALFPGFSLHDELEALVDCVGLTPMEAIEAGTRRAATLLGAEDSLGTIEVGKRADLLVLEADPTEDIGHTTRIAAVVKDGRWYGPDEIRDMLGGVDPGGRGDIELMPGAGDASGRAVGCVRPAAASQ